MRLRHIEVFRALMLTHSVTRAAQLLHTSQPTASRFLADLEREIGFALFSRTHGKLAPTPEAEALFVEVQRSFSGLDQIAEVAAGIASFRHDLLRISSISAFSLGVLVSVIQRFGARFPGVVIKLDVVSFNEVVRNVAANQCEIGFVAYPAEQAGISQRAIMEGRSVCVMPSNHRLARKKAVAVSDLRGERFIAIARNVPSGLHVDRIFSKAKVSRKIVLETQNAAVACAFVKQGMGVSILDPFTAAAVADERMVSRPFRPGFSFRFSALARSDRILPRIARLFLDEVVETVATQPQIAKRSDLP
jgi:DNA-binding transcriptional LysR family regulator